MDMDSFTSKYIIRELPDEEITYLSLKYNSLAFNEQFFRSEVVLKHTLVILALIEVSKNIQQFEGFFVLYKTRETGKTGDSRLSDFDNKLQELTDIWDQHSD